ncbi:MAG: hypothetical protein AB1425_01100 [Actinomycetota bacterium]
MELVFTLLVVALLVVLPVAFFLLAIGGLFYAISRAIRGEKREDTPPAPSSSIRGEPPGVAEPLVAKTTTSKGRKDA